MKQTKLTSEEFQKRCEEVFSAYERNKFYGLEIVNDQRSVVVSMGEEDTLNGERIILGFNYEPDMTDLPNSAKWKILKINVYNLLFIYYNIIRKEVNITYGKKRKRCLEERLINCWWNLYKRNQRSHSRNQWEVWR